jgi:hypothetical protein
MSGLAQHGLGHGLLLVMSTPQQWQRVHLRLVQHPQRGRLLSLLLVGSLREQLVSPPLSLLRLVRLPLHHQHCLHHH